MPGDEEDAIGLDQKPEGTGKPDRSASSPRHRVGVAGWDSTPCMSGLGKNNASGADRAFPPRSSAEGCPPLSFLHCDFKSGHFTCEFDRTDHILATRCSSGIDSLSTL